MNELIVTLASLKEHFGLVATYAVLVTIVFIINIAAIILYTDRFNYVSMALHCVLLALSYFLAHAINRARADNTLNL